MHCFLLLNNVSAIEAGQKHILSIEHEKTQYVIAESKSRMLSLPAEVLDQGLKQSLAAPVYDFTTQVDNSMFDNFCKNQTVQTEVSVFLE